MLRYGSVVLGGTALGWTLSDDKRRDRIARVARVGAVAVQVSAVYKWNLYNLEKDTPPYEEQLKKVNLFGAQKMLALCMANKGIYTKLGQHIASMNHVLPPEITTTLSPLQDQAVPVSLDTIEEMIETELGSRISDIFSSFSETPVAAASLAQVHKAVLKSTGTEVAVKVQYPTLTSQLSNDLWTMEWAMSGIEWMFKDDGFKLQWILPEFETVVAEELDFTKEASNAARVSNLFQNTDSVYIPKTFPKFSTKRVLTMEYIHGVKVTDTDAIKSLGLAPLDIASIISNSFARMICCEGFMHCDPHPGNLFVRKNKRSNKPQVVLLDHGLYREMTEDFRKTFCLLWKSLLTRDEALLIKCATSFGAKEYYNFFPLIFTYRTIKSTSRLGESMSEKDKVKLREDLKHLKVNDVSHFMQFLPRDMLYVFRISNLVRSLNKDLGGTGRSRFWAMGKHAIEGLVLEERPTVLNSSAVVHPKSKSWLGSLQYYYSYSDLMARLWFIDFSISIMQYFSK